MNARIKDLWDKAATASAAYPSGQYTSWETQVSFMDKFAELIVRECSQIAHNSHPDDLPFVGGKMLVHFGVEE